MEEVVEFESGSASADKVKVKVNDKINRGEKKEGFCSAEAELEGSGRVPERRRMCLKLNKIEAAAMGNPHVRVCRICKKEFSTGKALGGHMRMHAKDHKQEIGNNNNLMSESLADDDGKQNCRVCGKDFPSMKSLFGHMRSHPEREWRGIQPPVPVPSSCPIGSPSSEYSTLSDDLHPIVDSSSDHYAAAAVPATTTRPHSESDSGSGSGSDYSAIDLSSRLSMGWSVTAKRGRKGSYGSGLKPGIERRTEEAMYHLMILACANSNSNHLTLTHQSHSDTDTDTDDNKMTWEEQGSPKTESTPSASPESSRRMVVMTNNKRRRIKRMKLTELETGGSTDISKDHIRIQNETNKHVCSSCNKSFPTHQALGGHRSSHNKSKIIQNQNQNVKPDVVESESYDIRLDIATRADAEVINSNGNGNGNGHRCNICNKIFSTGQALGGHKRCHWKGNAETSEPHAKSAENSGAHPPDFLLGLIDLNELPAMEEQHQEVNAPSASASASNKY
ncbi:hypothetical protein L6164_030711 [Bauhinia variegata]|uniref:Uncharacterized protein n=1 Tax=Bauhinia variegata TaxID=167791 RepID=A0ACB9LD67_BAUVA|nr:hypothetical protein L6164_030711 [Bauhinia variegata]